MTHTNHRRGDRRSLEKDYIVLSMVDKNNALQCNYREPYEKRVKKLLEICAKYNPVALGNRTQSDRYRYMMHWEESMDSGVHHSSTIDEIINTENIDYICHAVYEDKDDLEAVLKELVEEDLGISIVASGIFDEVKNVCNKVGLEPHTINMSLGTWGKTSLLPPSPVIEICTMCGHGLISKNLVKQCLTKVEKNIMTAEEAAVELGKQCTCNIFNTKRAVNIINSTMSK